MLRLEQPHSEPEVRTSPQPGSDEGLAITSLAGTGRLLFVLTGGEGDGNPPSVTIFHRRGDGLLRVEQEGSTDPREESGRPPPSSPGEHKGKQRGPHGRTEGAALESC